MCDRLQHFDHRQQGRFANAFKSGYNSEEVVMDFGQGYEGEGDVTFHTRIVTSPMYARQMIELLTQTLEDFEAAYGPSRTRVIPRQVPRGGRRDEFMEFRRLFPPALRRSAISTPPA